jgi:uncharacterized Zn-binding protein involved in type VI secretion
MPGAARQGDAIQGTTAGEHNGHATPHGPLPITGTISGGCSGDVFINGRPAAYVGSTTTENDACCGSSQGSIAQGSSSVFINGKPAARIGERQPDGLGGGWHRGRLCWQRGRSDRRVRYAR